MFGINKKKLLIFRLKNLFHYRNVLWSCTEGQVDSIPFEINLQTDFEILSRIICSLILGINLGTDVANVVGGHFPLA